jgi:hypothetical protein
MGGGNGRPGLPMPRMGMIATGGSVGAAMSAQVLCSNIHGIVTDCLLLRIEHSATQPTHRRCDCCIVVQCCIFAVLTDLISARSGMQFKQQNRTDA